MHNNISYEEYMRTVLGYQPSYMNNVYSQEDDFYTMQTRNDYSYIAEQNNDLEKLYPECYNKIYPTVCKACSQCTGQMTAEQLERMADEVYDTVFMAEVRKDEKTVKQAENRETRQRNNNIRDLIKILILRELLGGGFPIFPGPGPRPPRPRSPFSGPEPRPPMPRPPFSGSR